MTLIIAPVAGFAVGRRSAWVRACLSVLTALALSYGSSPAGLWWAASIFFLAAAVLTTLPGVRQLLALAQLAVRGRHAPETPRASIPYEEIRKSTATGYQKSWGPAFMMFLFLAITAFAALSYSGMQDHPGGGIAAVESMGDRDPLGIYPLVLSSFLPWSAIGLLRLLLESIIGTVAWIIPAGEGGPVDFGRVKPLNDGANTVDDGPCPRTAQGPKGPGDLR